MSKNSKLVGGRIPKHTICPFRNECGSVESLPDWRGCKHKGELHEVDFSCAYARAFDLIHISESKEDKDNE